MPNSPNFPLPNFAAIQYAVSRVSNIELLILVSDFIVNYTLKTFKYISVQCMECLNEDMKKKKGWILHIGGRDDQINTGAK